MTTNANWHVSVSWDIYTTPYYQIRGDVAHDGDNAIKNQHEANARLLNAAPDLLEALKQCALADDADERMKIARAAIAKAEGK